MHRFPSGQRGQTQVLMRKASWVRIPLCAYISVGSRAVKGGGLKIHCVMLRGFEPRPTHTVFFLFFLFYQDTLRHGIFVGVMIRNFFNTGLALALCLAVVWIGFYNCCITNETCYFGHEFVFTLF